MLFRLHGRLFETLFVAAILFASAGNSVAAAGDAGVTTPTAYRPSDPLNAVAFEHFYSLEYDRAAAEFEEILRRHPDDPFALNHLTTAVLVRELYRVGALNSGQYANDSFLVSPSRPADPAVKNRLRQLIERAETLEEKELSANPKNADALYARGATRAQTALFTALLDRAWFSALRSAVGARRDHERVLQLDPTYTDAKLVVGTDYYVLGSLPWTVKIAAALIGLSGSKEKGLQYLSDVAHGKGEAATDAQIVLCLFLRREHRYDQALTIVRGLIARYPRNVLFALEEGNLLRAMERNQDAAATYQRIWQAGFDGHYPGLPYEMAALSLGDLLRGEKDYAGALFAYEQVSRAARPSAEVLQKANLEAGQMYDLLSERDPAVRKYEAVVKTDGATPLAAAARSYLKQPYRGE